MEAYVSISVFFIINGLILWYIPTEFNIFHNQKVSLLPFFLIAPWVLLVLIPSITMKMVSSELTQKTSLILFTKPITKWQIIIAKFLASLTISITTIIPSLIFVYSIWQLSEPKGNIDQGELIGSYIGICLLSALYSSIGLFCSSISKSTMVAFIMTVIIILVMYVGFSIIGNTYNNFIFEYLSIHSHYESMSRGVIDSRDLVYFISLTIGFLYFTIEIIDNKKI